MRRLETCARLALGVGGVLVSACGEPARDSHEGRGSMSLPIRGGEIAEGGRAGAGAVVGIYTYQDGGPALCSGTLLRPDLVLTARHCVARSVHGTRVEGASACETTEFGATLGAEQLGISRATELFPEALAELEAVLDVRVPNTTSACGADLALLVLGQVSATEDKIGAIVEPRWEPLRIGELVTALGYGSDGELYGVRRRSEPFPVECVGALCKGEVVDGEFAAAAVTLEGDSGGPALTASGELGGVLSRHDGGLAVYQALAPWRDWLERYLDDPQAASYGGARGDSGLGGSAAQGGVPGAGPRGTPGRAAASCSVVAPGSGR